MIGAGAVVTKDVAAYALMIGVPARQVGWVDKNGNACDAPPGMVRIWDQDVA
jgi:UDP-2-acetamido-3-amino-2,3-dideoxy-glucuronate N-acetyltransferase